MATRGRKWKNGTQVNRMPAPYKGISPEQTLRQKRIERQEQIDRVLQYWEEQRLREIEYNHKLNYGYIRAV